MASTYNDARQFLQAVFPDHAALGIFANLKPPLHVRDFMKLDAGRDCYWSVAAFPSTATTNLKADALGVQALVIDDVGTKVTEDAVRLALGAPTAIVETSAGNYQWTYRLAVPVPKDQWDGVFAEVERLVGVPLEGKDAVHLFRLPMGVNTKPGRGGFRVRLVAVDPKIEVGGFSAASSTAAGPGPSSGASPRVHGQIRELLKILANGAGVSRDEWVSRAHQIKALAVDEAEGWAAFDEWSAKWPGGYDPDETRRVWDSIHTVRISGLGLLEEAEAADPAGFARVMNREAASVFDDGEVKPAPPGPKVSGLVATPFKWADLSKTSPRDWLYGDILLRKFISMTVAPGGVGKSSLVAVETLAQVTGKALLGENPSDELRVWLWNLEDPYEETQKKLLAAAKHYGIGEAEIGDRLFVDSGRDQRLVIAEMDRTGPMIVRPVVRALVEQIRAKRIDVVVIDPFVSSHGVPENDNGAMDMVVKEWGRVAEEGNCAVHLVDHTRKAGADTEVVTESSRGAKAKTDAARVVRVVNRMTAADGKAWGVTETWRYFNTFNDKANMAPPKARRDWFRMESVLAGNGGGAARAFSAGAAGVPRHGDSVGVAVQWVPPTAHVLAAGGSFVAMKAAMAGKTWRKSTQSDDWIGIAVAKALDLDLRHSKQNRVLINEVLAQWIKAGLLKEVPQLDEYRKEKVFIEIAQTF